MPPKFAIATPVRIAFDFPNTANDLGRSSQDIGQGELRSMNVIQGAERTRLVLNLDKMVPYDTCVDGNNVVLMLGAREGTGGSAASALDVTTTAAAATRLALSRLPRILIILPNPARRLPVAILDPGGKHSAERG